MHETTSKTTRIALRQSSVQVILSSQSASGAYPAALGYEVYNYSWFRDGAFVAEAMSQVGEVDSATAFHMWCRKVLTSRADRIQSLVERNERGDIVPSDELLPTRYELDGTDGTADWWDFQLDGYGTWLWALEQHLERHAVDPEPFCDVVELTARYLLTFGDRPCYDWWEEFREHRHSSTIASVIAGLRSALSVLGPHHRLVEPIESGVDRFTADLFGALDESGSLTKWAGSPLVDGSLLATFAPFGVIAPGDDTAEATYARVRDDLAPYGGVYRYLGDTFYGGGEWIILTALLGIYESRTGRAEQAIERLRWIVGQATVSGALPEQSSDHIQFPDRVAEWVERWGPVATPLLWSHAMFLFLDSELDRLA